jgi:type I restriction enzyme S subunit
VAESIQYGYTASAIDRRKGPRFLRITDIQDGRVDWEAVPSCDIPAEDIPKYRLSSGDLVFARTGATTGKSYLIGDCPEAVFASYLIRVRTSADVNPRYLSAYFQSADYWRQIESGKRGIGQPNVNGKVLGEIELPLAPLDQQRDIVAEIEKQFTRLEAGVAGLRRVQANLKRYRAAVLKAAYEGKLVPTQAELAWHEGRSYETGAQLLERILAERRQKWNGKGKYKEPPRPEMAELPALPQGWTWGTVEQLAAPDRNSVTDGPFGSNLKTEHYTAAGPRVIRLQNIGDGVFVDEDAHISDEHFLRLQKHRVFAGDLVIAALGENPPRSCVIPATVGLAIVKADCIRYKPHSDLAVRYINCVLNAEPTRKRTKTIVHGVGRPRLNLGEIKSIVIPVPPVTEQWRIVSEVERRLSVVEELEAVVNVNLQRATRLRQTILEEAFEGKLVRAGGAVQSPGGQKLSLAAEAPARYGRK